MSGATGSRWVGLDAWLRSQPEEKEHDGADGLAALVALVLRIEQERPEWQKDALCQEYPEVSFFPATAAGGAVAKEVCRRCLVQDPCLDYALSNGIEHGVWSGVQGTALRRLRQTDDA